MKLKILFSAAGIVLAAFAPVQNQTPEQQDFADQITKEVSGNYRKIEDCLTDALKDVREVRADADKLNREIKQMQSAPHVVNTHDVDCDSFNLIQ